MGFSKASLEAVTTTAQEPFASLDAALDFVYASLLRANPYVHGLPDAARRRPDLWRALADALGSVDRSLRIGVVAGSKGKGSTAVMTASLLSAATGHVGLITSPHLLHFEERVRIDGNAIGEGPLTRILSEIAPSAKRILATAPPGAYFSPVGYALLAGLLFFHERSEIRLAVLEAGRGGKFDETSKVAHAVATLTPIFREHVHELGPTLAEIADHKAGIIVPGTQRAVIGRQAEPVERQLSARAAEAGVPVWTLGCEFTARHAALNSDASEVDLMAPSGRLHRSVRIGLHGRHQADNAAVALASAEALLSAPLSDEAVRLGLGRVRWPGRLERLSWPDRTEGPPVWVDAAIVKPAAKRALAFVRRHHEGPIAAIVAVPEGKDYRGVWAASALAADHVWITAAQTPYLTFPVAEAKKYCQEDIFRRTFSPHLRAALTAALETRPGAIVFLGTLSFVAEVLAFFGADLSSLWPPVMRMAGSAIQ